MALSLTEIQALTDNIWLPGSYPQWGKGNIMLFKFLEKREKKGSREYAQVVLEYAKAWGGPMGAATIFNTARKAVLNAARYPWGYFWSGATIDINDMTQVSGGDGEIDIVFAKLDNMQRSLKAYMGDSLWELYATQQSTYGGETVPFYGIADMMNQSDTSPAYGLINMADLGTDEYGNNIWACFQDATAYSMDFGTMQILRRGCRIGNQTEEKPDLYVTTEDLKDAYEESLNAAKRHHDDKLAAAGFENVLVGLAPMVADDRATASYVHGFNTEYLYFHVHEDFDFKDPVWLQPTDQYIKTTQSIFVGTLLTSQRRAHGRLTNVS